MFGMRLRPLEPRGDYRANERGSGKARAPGGGDARGPFAPPPGSRLPDYSIVIFGALQISK